MIHRGGGGHRRPSQHYWRRSLRGNAAGDGATTAAAAASGNVKSSPSSSAVVDVRLLLATGTHIDITKNGISDHPRTPPGMDDDDMEKEEEEEEKKHTAVVAELVTKNGQEGVGDVSNSHADATNNGGRGGNGNNNNKNDNKNTKYNNGYSPIPHAQWPVSIRDDGDGTFENVIHPGHKAMGHPDVVMSVPRFWMDDPVSVHRNTLMSRDVAMQIGSCAQQPNTTTTTTTHNNNKSNHNYNRGEDCPVNDRTIYVAIASYRDWQCRETVTSIFSRATYPERIRVAVTDQIVEGEDEPCDIVPTTLSCAQDPTQTLCRHKSRLDVFQMDAPLSIGPVFARHFGHRMYRGEYYAMQVDAHVTFTTGWDVDIVRQHRSTGNEMAVLSTYLTDIDGAMDGEGNSLLTTRPIMCNTDYEEGQENRYLRHGSQPESEPSIRGMPQLEPYWAAGFSFSRGHFVVNVPYDYYQPMIFQGEEMSIGIRGFTIGYDYYAPERSVCFHHYADGKNKRGRDRVPHYWENGNMYAGSGVHAMYRLLGIVHMNPEVGSDMWDHTEESKYGLGNVRSPELFYNVFGIDVQNKVAEEGLCKFVETGIMHTQFMQALRSDGMGIDYGKISYRFKASLVKDVD